MRAQLFTVPFENLDVQAGKIVSLVPEDIAGKLLGGGRGGVTGVALMGLAAGAGYYLTLRAGDAQTALMTVSFAVVALVAMLLSPHTRRS